MHRFHRKFVGWALIVALLNLALVVGPGGMIMASPFTGDHLVRVPHTATVDAAPCHDNVGQLASPQTESHGACAGTSCADDCTQCLQLSLGAPMLSESLVAINRSIVETIAREFSDPESARIPRPPQTLHS